MNSKENWIDLCLGDLADGYRGVSYQPNHLLSEQTDRSVTLLRATNIQNGRLDFRDVQIVPESIVKQTQKLKIGDVAVCMSNGSKRLVGKSAQFTGEHSAQYTVGAFCAIFRPKPNADQAFVKQLFESEAFQSHIDISLAGSAINNLKNSDVENVPFCVPPKPTQSKIAIILQTIDEAIAQTEALIEKYSLVKAGMMHDLFTRGLTPDGKLRPPREEAPDLYKETPMGWIPKEWKYDLLDKSTDRRSGHTPSKSFPEYWNGGVKWVSLADSHRLDRLYIDDTDFEISTLGLQNSSAVLLPAGMVIMSRDAGIGKSAITTKPMAVSQHFMAWQCADKMDKYFLYYWLQLKKRMFENIAMGSTILTIGLSYFKRLKIAAPSDLDEQKQIGKRLKQADTLLFSLEEEVKKLKKQKSGLMRDLLTGEVLVKANDPEAAHV